MFVPIFRVVALSFLIALMSISSASADDDNFRAAFVEELASTPGDYEGRVITAGYVELIGFTNYSFGEGKHRLDVASATYKLWSDQGFKGSYIFVVVEDVNNADNQDNPPVVPVLVESEYYQIEGDWLQYDKVVTPEIAPGSITWALRSHGFD